MIHQSIILHLSLGILNSHDFRFVCQVNRVNHRKNQKGKFKGVRNQQNLLGFIPQVPF